MADTIDTLKQIAQQIRYETEESKNTAERVGRTFVGILELIQQGVDVENLAKTFLRKDRPDSTSYLIKFLSGLECGDYQKGSTGVGVYKDDAGNWHIETDYLDVRMKLSAKEVEIQKVFHIGGAEIKSSASMKCIRVEELEDAYRCYMNTTDEDGQVIYNQFKAGDQAYVQTFNIERQADGTLGNRFFWRLVTAVGTDYIDLSKSIAAIASDAPKAFDDIVQLGYRGTDDPSRQVAVIDAGAGEGAPYYRQYVGINSFRLPEPETQLKPGDNELTGRLHIEPGSTGWRNMDGLPEEIQDAADLAADALTEAESAKELADGAAQEAADAQDRLDGWASDGMISPTEKLTLKQEQKDLQAEYESNLADAQKYGIDASAYTAAWNAYKTELEYHSSDTPENITVRPAFATSQSAFYAARTALLASIAAKAKEYVDTSIGSIGVGSVNLLRNSSFLGDYKDEELEADTPLTSESELYSKALKHWTGMATVQDDAEAASGKSAVIGSLSQSVTLISNESYIISYKAKGTSLAVSCGDYSVSQPLTSDYRRYKHSLTFSGAGVLMLSGTATVCDIQLERGTIATDWKPSPLDNDRSMAEFQSLSYIYDVLKNGSVDFIGGLILASMIQLGNYKDGKMQKVTAGISGIYNDDDDVYTWGGGTFEQAIRTVMAFKNNPKYQPTEQELASMANAVITHGGRAILNDVILRGYIYALGGVFQGKVEIAGGKILLDDDGSGRFADGSFFWDVYGRTFQKSRPSYVWRSIMQEMDEQGTTERYDLDLRKGTYLDIIKYASDTRSINLPPAGGTPGMILDVKGLITTRSVDFYSIRCIPDNGIMLYNAATESYESKSIITLESSTEMITDTIESALFDGSYRWVAGRKFITKTN